MRRRAVLLCALLLALASWVGTGVAGADAAALPSSDVCRCPDWGMTDVPDNTYHWDRVNDWTGSDGPTTALWLDGGLWQPDDAYDEYGLTGSASMTSANYVAYTVYARPQGPYSDLRGKWTDWLGNERNDTYLQWWYPAPVQFHGYQGPIYEFVASGTYQTEPNHVGITSGAPAGYLVLNGHTDAGSSLGVSQAVVKYWYADNSAPPGSAYLLHPASIYGSESWLPHTGGNTTLVATEAGDGIYVTNGMGRKSDLYTLHFDSGTGSYSHYQVQVKVKRTGTAVGHVDVAFDNQAGGWNWDLDKGGITDNDYTWYRGPRVQLPTSWAASGIVLGIGGEVTSGVGSLYVDTVRLKMW